MDSPVSAARIQEIHRAIFKNKKTALKEKTVDLIGTKDCKPQQRLRGLQTNAKAEKAHPAKDLIYLKANEQTTIKEA